MKINAIASIHPGRADEHRESRGSAPGMSFVAALAILLTLAPALAQDEDAPDAPAPPDAEAIEVDPDANGLIIDGEPLDIVVRAVQGMVQVRTAPEEAWQRAEAGMDLPVGAELRTGPNSIVQFTVGPDQVITLDRLGTIQVLEAIQAEGLVNTDLGMPYGRASYEIQAREDVEHAGQIRGASATLAVDGTLGFLDDYADRPPLAGSDRGNVAFRNTAGQLVHLDPPARIEGDQTAGGEYEIAQATFNPFGPGISDQERRLLGRYGSGTFHQWLVDMDAGQFRAYGSAAASFAEFARFADEPGFADEPEFEFMPGSLTFEAGWFGFEPDTEMEVTNGWGELLNSEQPDRAMTESGGQIEIVPGEGSLIRAQWVEQVPLTDFSTMVAALEEETSLHFFRGELRDGEGQLIDELEIGEDGMFAIGERGSEVPPPGVMTIDLRDAEPGFDYTGWRFLD